MLNRYTLVFGVACLFFLSISARSQKKITVFVDSDSSVSTAECDVVVVLKDDANVISSLLISSEKRPAADWTTHDMSKSKSIPLKLKVIGGKPTPYSILAFGRDGKTVEVKNITVPNDKPVGDENSGQGDQGGSGKPDPIKEKKIALQKPKPVVESKYDLEIKPNFDKKDIPTAEYYKIENKVRNHDNDPVIVPIQIEDGFKTKPRSSQYVQVELFRGNNEITVSLLDKDKKPVVDGFTDKVEIECDEPCEAFGQSINTRAIIGLEQVGASSAVGKTNPFLDFFINVPLGDNDSPNETPPRVSIWTNFRLTSSTAQRLANLSNITTNILRPSATSDINEVVQSFRVNAGFAIRIIPEKTLFPSFLPGKSSVSVIFGAGVMSPLTGGKNSVTEIFKIPKVNGQIIPEFLNLFPGISNDKENIAFVTPERDRFMRRWFFGGRLLSHFYKSKSSAMDISPATLDVTAGQDEAITRKLSGWVLNFEGFTPFPIKRLDYLYLYAGISTRLTRKVNSNVPSFFLQPADIADLADPLKTVLISADENRFTVSNRDRYFFGIGVDLIRLFRKSSDEDSKKP